MLRKVQSIQIVCDKLVWVSACTSCFHDLTKQKCSYIWIVVITFPSSLETLRPLPSISEHFNPWIWPLFKILKSSRDLCQFALYLRNQASDDAYGFIDVFFPEDASFHLTYHIAWFSYLLTLHVLKFGMAAKRVFRKKWYQLNLKDFLKLLSVQTTKKSQMQDLKKRTR